MPAGTPPKKNWIGRNWKWFVPVIVVTAMLLITAFVVGLLAIFTGAMRSTEPYQHAVEVVGHDSRAVSALGAPVKVGWLVTGAVNVSGPTGGADLAIPVRGPAHAGTVYVVAKKSAGRWSYETLELEVDGNPERIKFVTSTGGSSGKY
jgi:hypothetical protein